MRNERDYFLRQPFFDGEVGVARFDKPRYPQFNSLTERQLGYFWRPQEIDISRDGDDFKKLSSGGQRVFTGNLRRQIVLDSEQARSPLTAFLPHASLPEIEGWLQVWGFSEAIHSRSYQYIINGCYSNPSVVYDDLMSDTSIAKCASEIGKCYDDLEALAADPTASLYEKKKALWKAMVAVNTLEGLRFYVSFACSWAFAETGTMEGNSTIITMIARDENLHLAGTQHFLKMLPRDFEEYAQIKAETYQECSDMFEYVADEEKAWAHELFKEGSVIGLNEKSTCALIDWLRPKRKRDAGFALLPSEKVRGECPLPFVEKRLNGKKVQSAPQETEETSYMVGQVEQTKDVDLTQFANMF